MGAPGLFRLDFGQKTLGTSERTLGVSGLGALVPISDGDSSGDVEGPLVLPFRIAGCLSC